MTEIVDIYKGYLDLIEYLEEKFPGGIAVPRQYDNTVVAVSEEALHLLTISPATKVTTDHFIRASCNRFNTLGTTQLSVYQAGPTVKVHAPKVTPFLAVLYHLIHRVGPAHVMAPGLYTEMDALKAWVKIITADRVESLNLKGVGRVLRRYTEKHGGKHVETQALMRWLHEHGNGNRTAYTEYKNARDNRHL